MNNKLKIVIFFFILTTQLSGQTSTHSEKYYIDSQGKSINEEDFLKIFKSKNNRFSVWKYTTIDSGTVTKINVPRYAAYKIDYSDYHNYIKKITKKNYPDSTIFLIGFRYLDDMCNSSSIKNPNIWDKGRIATRKSFLNEIKKDIELAYKNVVHLEFFEKGIRVKNTNSSKEYFYSDEENYLRELFKNRTLCGSYLIIKPDGSALVYNGEYRPDLMIEHLKIWDMLFEN